MLRIEVGSRLRVKILNKRYKMHKLNQVLDVKGIHTMNALGTMNKPLISGVMWKTVSEACNLACDYCYYSRLNGRPGKIERIADDVLEKFICEYMEMKKGVVPFAWQGGEPLLAGLDFFKKVVSLQAKYAPKNTIISNSIQTNGTMIKQEWAEFFKQFNFLVGISLDGTEEMNDARRVTGSGKGSFKAIMNGIQHLRNANVDFNILSVIHENNVFRAKELMAFYKQEGFTFVQFIPCMDFKAQDVDQPGKYLITPKQYGDFLCEAFDSWYNDGHPEISIRFFDNMLAVYLNQEAESCMHRETCPTTIVFEQNGDAYPCDFYIHDKYCLGNIGTDSLESIVNHEKMKLFLKKKPAIPDACKSCEFLKLCHGGCPRNRQHDESDLDYFCESYQQVYRYAHERMKVVALNYRKKEYTKLKKNNFRFPGRNERCLCGSGKKYKKCCEAIVEQLS